jgi:hypothetical protein
MEIHIPIKLLCYLPVLPSSLVYLWSWWGNISGLIMRKASSAVIHSIHELLSIVSVYLYIQESRVM